MTKLQNKLEIIVSCIYALLIFWAIALNSGCKGITHESDRDSGYVPYTRYTHEKPEFTDSEKDQLDNLIDSLEESEHD